MLLSRFLVFSGRLSPSRPNIHGGFAVEAYGQQPVTQPAQLPNLRIQHICRINSTQQIDTLTDYQNNFTVKQTDVDQIDNSRSFTK